MEELEIKEEKDAVRKNMLLQKYGIIAPKLTTDETLAILLEEDRKDSWERMVRAMRVVEGAE